MWLADPLAQGRSGGALDIVYKSTVCWGIVTRDPEPIVGLVEREFGRPQFVF